MRSWVILGAMSLVTFLLLLDDTAVAVALPDISQRLGLTLTGQGWVINAYTLTLATVALPAGRLADRWGRRRVFLTGIAVFMVGSLASGLAVSGSLLIASRAVQGLGAALTAPASLAIIAATFPGTLRGAAIGLWAGVSAVALGLGPLFGAIVSDSLGWAWIFWLNVPLGAAGWLLTRAVVHESRAARPPRTLDAGGAGLSSLALLALLLALGRGNEAGWSAPGTMALFLTAAASGWAFVRHEKRHQEPLLDPAWFKDSSFTGANVEILLVTSVMCSLFFFFALYLQTVLGYSALQAATALLPLTGSIVAMGPAAGRLADRIGPRIPVAGGMLLLAGALVGLSAITADSRLADLVPWLAAAGVGIGLVTAPVTTLAMGSGASAAYAAAAAAFNTFRTTGLTLGVAVMGAILASFGPVAAFSRNFGSSHHAAFVAGLSTAVTINAGVALGAAAIAAYVFRRRRNQDLTPRGVPEASERY